MKQLEAKNEPFNQIQPVSESVVSIYEQGFNNAVDVYSIKDSAFRHPKRKIFDTAAGLYKGYEVNPAITASPEACLFTLAVADQWLSSPSFEERKRLLDILKLTTVRQRALGTWDNLSGKVRTLSNNGSERGTPFDPDALIGNIDRNFSNNLKKYMREHIDEKDSAIWTIKAVSWDKPNEFSSIRSNLGLTQDSQRIPLILIVLKKTSDEILAEMGFGGITSRSNLDGTNLIILGSDLKGLEHEYTHSQTEGLNTGFRGSLFRGLSEARTEAFTTNPTFYPQQREVMDHLFTSFPGIESAINSGYKYGGQFRIDAYSALIKFLGLDGFLHLARMNPNPQNSTISNLHLYNDINQIFIPTHNIRSMISRKKFHAIN